MAGHLIRFINFRIKSRIGFSQWIKGKAVYIMYGGSMDATSYQERQNSERWFTPVIICDDNYFPGSDEYNEMITLITDYVNNYDDDYLNREEKLPDAAKWKLEQLIINGVDLTDSVERKIWQKRVDLLSELEKDGLISEWESR